MKIQPEIISKPSKLIQEYPELSSQAYGKQPTIADYPRLGEIRAKAFWQENEPRLKDITTMVKYPKEEIQYLNYMAKLSSEFKPSGKGSSAPTTTSIKPGAGAGTPRVISKSFGGKTIGGLSKEPSLKSMGVSEPALKESGKVSVGSRADYRGKAGSMKPMGEFKQAGTRQIALSEQLPAVEGMTIGRVSPQSQRGGVPAMFTLPKQLEVVTVTEPELEFAQESRRRQDAGLMPAFVSSQRSALEMSRDSMSAMGVESVSRQRNALAQMVDLARDSGLRQREGTETVMRRELASIREPETIPDIFTYVGTRTTITPVTTIITRQPTDLILPPYETTITKPRPVIEPPFVKIPGEFLPPGSGRGTPRYGARYRSKATTYAVGADLLGASRGSFTPIKMPKRKPFKMPKF